MKTEIFAHRGFSGYYPENTLLSFKRAIDEGVDGIELDVQMTKDKELVVIHDEQLGRTFQGNGFIQDHTLSELKEKKLSPIFQSYLDYEREWEKEKIPTLIEVLELLKETDVILNIELKTIKIPYEGMVEKVMKEVESCHLQEKVIYSSFHYPTLYEVQQYSNKNNTAWLVPFDIPRVNEYVESLNVDGLHLSKDIALAKPKISCDYAERLWTINSQSEMVQAISQGYTSIMTDYPDMALKIREKINAVSKN